MRVVVLLLAGMLATACTTVVEGTPSAPTGVLLPPRPREVRLDGVDPCSLLTAEQRVELGLDGKPVFKSSYAELFRGSVPTCTFVGLGREPIAVGVGTVTSVGIELWQRGDLPATIKSTSVAGFPAVVAVPSRLKDFCSVEVDVARGQLLDVQFSDGGGRPPLDQEELCLRARRTAEMMMMTLVSS